MSLDPKFQTPAYAATREIDAGLQAFMRGVYNTMGTGLVISGLVAYAVANIEPVFKAIFGTPLAFVAMLAPLAFIFFGFTPARVARMPAAKVKSLFYFFAALMGVSLATIFVAFTGESVARMFFVTAAAFAAMSLWGYTTRRDLTGMGSFLFMGLIGIFIAAIVNLFMQSAAMQFVISAIGVLVFTGLTAWDTQRLKETYAESAGREANDKVAVMGALSLYLNFVNLMQMLLHLFGDRR